MSYSFAVETFSGTQCLKIETTMKNRRTIVPTLLCLLTSTLFLGCSSVSVPPAKTYVVRAGDTVFVAKSVKIHGSWAECETDTGSVWVSGAVITPKK